MGCTGEWVRGPVGLDAGLRVTRTADRAVLVMVPSIAAGTRLLDLLPLIEVDHRVQAVFTVPHADEVWHGVEEFARRTGGIVLPWAQAVQQRWDLVLTASHRHIEQVRGPLLVLPHGAGSLGCLRYSRKAGAAIRHTTGLDRDLLTFRGRLLPAALALSHELEMTTLRRTCPEAEPVAVVAGDPCLDRMVASLEFRDRYRHALGVSDDQRLITISSTWGKESTFGRHPEVYERILAEAGPRTVVAAVVHPLVHAAHGTRQLRSWLAAARCLLVIPPDEGWRATMIASDHVLGDHGSTTSYAAAIGRPVHLVTYPDRAVRPTSIAATVARFAPHLDHQRPLLAQLRDAAPTDPMLREMLTSSPGAAARILRSVMYRLLQLDEPSWPAPTAVLPLPRPMGAEHVW